MEHSSIDMLIRAEVAPSSTLPPSRAASMAVPSPSGLLSAKLVPPILQTPMSQAAFGGGSGLAAPLAVRVKKGRLVLPGSSSVLDAQDLCPIRRKFLPKKPLLHGLPGVAPRIFFFAFSFSSVLFRPFEFCFWESKKGTTKNPRDDFVWGARAISGRRRSTNVAGKQASRLRCRTDKSRRIRASGELLKGSRLHRRSEVSRILPREEASVSRPGGSSRRTLGGHRSWALSDSPLHHCWTLTVGVEACF